MKSFVAKECAKNMAVYICIFKNKDIWIFTSHTIGLLGATYKNFYNINLFVTFLAGPQAIHIASMIPTKWPNEQNHEMKR